jgi:signal peptidase I
MDIQEIKRQGLKYEYKITVPAKHLKHLVEQELQHIGEGVSLPGFRKGKVPLDVLEKRYGADARKAAMEKAMQEASQKVFKDNKVVPALNPKFAIEQYKPDVDLIFNMYFEVLPEIKIHPLKDFPLSHHKVKVGDEQIQESLNKIAHDYHTTAPIKKARATQLGDVVLIDFNVDQFLRVKRLVGLPGDEIEIDANGDLRVNGQMVLHHLPDFPFVESQFIFFNSAVLTNEGKFIPENRTLVLSDNPLHAADSRTWGFVSPDLFVGKVVEVIPAPE